MWKKVAWEKVFANPNEIVGDRIFLRSAIIRKDLLPRYSSSMPWTTTVETATEVERAVRSYPSGGRGIEFDEGWTLKPSDSSNAYGVRCFPKGKDPSDLDERDTVWILQRTIPSFLFDGCKCHLRVLVLIVGDLEFYVYDDARILIAPVPAHFEDDPHAYLTNRSFNQTHPDYDDNIHNRSLTKSMPDDFAQPLLRKIRDIVASLATNLDDHVSSAKRDRSIKRHFFPLANTFELFGFDFMLDRSHHPPRPLLLEANPEPSLSMFGLGLPDLLQHRCPIRDGVPRSATLPGDDNNCSIGFTKVFSKRLRAALAEIKRRRPSASSSSVSSSTVPSLN